MLNPFKTSPIDIQIISFLPGVWGQETMSLMNLPAVCATEVKIDILNSR